MDKTEPSCARASTHGCVPNSSRALRLLLAFLLLAIVLPAQAAERLFSAPAGRVTALAADGGTQAPAGFKRVRKVQINAPMLAPTSPLRRQPGRRSAMAADQPSFVLNLFTDTELEVTVNRTDSKGTANFTSYGKVAGQPHSQVILSVNNGVMAGSIFVPGKNSIQISYAGDGYHMVGEIDPEQSAPCNVLVPPVNIPAALAGDRPVMAADGETRVDVMVLYTPAARSGAGGASGIQSLIDTAVAEANEAYGNSSVAVELNLVHHGEISYSETGNPSTDLPRLQTVGDGQLESAHTLRAQYGADVVVLVTETMDTYSGLAYVMTPPTSVFKDFAFAVVKRQQLIGGHVFAHEVGHLMGCQHNVEDASSAGAYAYSYGHRFNDGSTDYRTVMAYEPGTRIPHFSNPSINFNGVPTGVTNTADNALTINNTASYVSAFAGQSTLIAFELASTNVTEESTTLTFNVVRQGPDLASTATVQYSSAGISSTAGSDYTATDGTVTFNPGETNQTIQLTILDDPEVESSEVVRLTLSNPAGPELGVERTLEVTILDDDTGIRFETSTASVDEDGTNIIVNVRRTGDTSATNTVDYATADTTATAGSDYTAATGTLTFEPGETNHTISVAITADSAYETNETFRISLANPQGGAALGSPSNIVITILEDDSTISFTTNAVSAVENVSSVTLTLTRGGGANGTTTLDYLILDGTATGGGDFTTTNDSVTFGAGVRTKTITIPFLNDTDIEGDETFSVIFTNLSGAAYGTHTNATVTILDNDSTFDFSTNAVSVNESDRSVTLTVLRSGGSSGSASVRYSTTTNGTASSSTDYSARIGTLSFAAGQTNKSLTIPLRYDTTYETNETFEVILSDPSADAALGTGTNVTVTIADTTSYLSFDTNAVTVSEGAGAANIIVNRTGALTETNRLSFRFFNGTATASDFSGTNSILTFLPGETNATITVPITDDSLVETNENFRITVSLPTGGAMLLGANTAYVTIDENDVGLEFTEATYSASEAGTNVTLTVVQTGDLDATNSVEYLTSDIDATAGGDYTSTTGTLNFGPGANSLTITVPVLNDTTVEPNETFYVSLTNVAGATLLANSNAVVTILEEDSVLSFSTNAITVIENSTTANLTVLRTGGANYTITVDYLTADGSATNAVDYTNTTGTLTFDPGVTSSTISVPLINDSAIDGDNNFTVSLTNASPGSVSLGATTNATVAILDNDSEFNFETNAVTVAETSGSVTVNVTRSGGLADSASVRYSTTTNGTATSSTDYTPRSSLLRFAAGETNKSFSIPVRNDTSNESSETFTVILLSPTDEGVLGTNDTVTVTVNDNDSVISWETNLVSVSESAGTVTLNVSRSGTLTGTNTISYTVTAATARTTDYTSTNGTLTFLPNSTNETITIAIEEDDLIETNEYFRVTLSGPSTGALLGGTNALAVTITEDDAGLEFSAPSYNVSETGTNVTVTVVQTGNLDLTNTVEYLTSDLSATAGLDYTATNGTLNFGPGTNSLTIVIPVSNDSAVETNESFQVSLTNAVNAVLLNTSNAVVNILENDSVLALSTNAISVDENGTTALITVARTGGTNLTNSVTYDTADGTATNGVDYTNTTGTLTFNPGAATATISVPLINDSDVDGDNSFTVSLSDPNGAALGATTNITVTILDNDSVFNFETNAVTVAEVARSIVLTVTRTGGVIGAASVRYATTNDSATAGVDYTTRTGILTFRAGETNRTITVPVANDLSYETNELFNLVLSSPSGEGTVGTNDTVAVTITDNDSQLSFDTNAVSVAENAGTVSLTVNRTGTLTTTNSIYYSAIQGTARTTDYTSTNGILTFGPNETNATITVSIGEDSIVESDEYFTVRLSNPTGGAVLTGTNIAVITITEDNAGLEFSSAVFSTNETGGIVVLSVVQTGNLDATNSVEFFTSDISATNTLDYTNTTGTLNFGPGTNSLTISVPIANDSLLESNETFRVSLTNVAGAVLLSTSNAIVTILEDDSSLAFSTNAVAVNENAGTATFTVLRTGGANDTVTVDYLTADGSATNALDFTNVSGTLSFGPGVTSRTISVPLINDSEVDGDETFNLILTNVSVATLGSETNLAVTIHDNDSVIQFSSNAGSVAENAGRITLTLERTGGLAGSATVRYATTNDSAEGGYDYVSKSGVVSFAAGETNKTFVIAIKNDTSYETNESFNVVLSSPTGEATVGTNDTTAVTITDNDSTLSFDAEVIEVSEGTATLTITVNREGTLTQTNNVSFRFYNGTARSTDYTATNGILVFLPGSTNETITVGIDDDDIVESTETFYVNLMSPTGGALISGTNRAAINISENDTGIAFSAATFSAGETETNVTVTIVQTGDTNAAVTVDYFMADLTATDGDDYTSTNGTLEFGPGTNTLTLNIPVLDDTEIEENETFRISLTNITGGTLLAQSNTVVSILEDDSSIAFSTNAVTVIETATYANLIVLRTGGTNYPATIDFAISTNSTATAGADYTSTNGTLNFDPGIRTLTIRLPLANDSDVEGDETVILDLSSATNALIGAHTNTTLTIADNDSVFSFTTNSVMVAENAGTTLISVVRTGGIAGIATVRYSMTNGTATAGADYRTRTGTLRFSAGQTNRTIALSILNDLVVDTNETFTIGLSSPTGEATLDVDVETVTILDNDFAFGATVQENNSNPLGITGFGWDDHGAATLEVDGPLGSAFTIEATADFSTWSEVASGLLDGSALLLRDPDSAGQTNRFYRLRQPDPSTATDE